jgi:hypothetical protein
LQKSNIKAVRNLAKLSVELDLKDPITGPVLEQPALLFSGSKNSGKRTVAAVRGFHDFERPVGIS